MRVPHAAGHEVQQSFREVWAKLEALRRDLQRTREIVAPPATTTPRAYPPAATRAPVEPRDPRDPDRPRTPIEGGRDPIPRPPTDQDPAAPAPVVGRPKAPVINVTTEGPSGSDYLWGIGVIFGANDPTYPSITRTEIAWGPGPVGLPFDPNAAPHKQYIGVPPIVVRVASNQTDGPRMWFAARLENPRNRTGESWGPWCAPVFCNAHATPLPAGPPNPEAFVCFHTSELGHNVYVWGSMDARYPYAWGWHVRFSKTKGKFTNPTLYENAGVPDAAVKVTDRAIAVTPGEWTIEDPATDFVAAGVAVGNFVYLYRSTNLATGEIIFPAANVVKAVAQHTLTLDSSAKHNIAPAEDEHAQTVNRRYFVATRWANLAADGFVVEQREHWGGMEWMGPGFADNFWIDEALFVSGRFGDNYGYGPWIAHNGVSGSTNMNDAVAFTPQKIQSSAYGDGSVSTLALENGAATAIKQSKGAQIREVSGVTPSNATHNSLSLSAGVIYFADGGTHNINAVNPAGLADGAHYLYIVHGNNNLVVTTSPGDVVGDNRYPIGHVIKFAGADYPVQWEGYWTGGGTYQSAQRVAAYSVSSIIAFMGAFYGGSVTVPASGNPKSIITSAGAHEFYDAAGVKRTEVSAGRIKLTESDATPGEILFGDRLEFYCKATHDSGSGLTLAPKNDEEASFVQGFSDKRFKYYRLYSNEWFTSLYEPGAAPTYRTFLNWTENALYCTRFSGINPLWSAFLKDGKWQGLWGVEPAGTGNYDVGAAANKFRRLFLSEYARLASIMADGGLTGYTDVFTILDTSSNILAACGVGSNNLYGWQLGARAAHRGSIWLKRRETSAAMPGTIIVQDKNGGDRFLWVDTAGKLRIHTSDPQDNDTLGTIVGTQS